MYDKITCSKANSIWHLVFYYKMLKWNSQIKFGKENYIRRDKQYNFHAFHCTNAIFSKVINEINIKSNTILSMNYSLGK